MITTYFQVRINSVFSCWYLNRKIEHYTFGLYFCISVWYVGLRNGLVCCYWVSFFCNQKRKLTLKNIILKKFIFLHQVGSQFHHVGFFAVAHRLSSCGTETQQLWHSRLGCSTASSRILVPQPSPTPVPTALHSGFLTTGPPGSLKTHFY